MAELKERVELAVGSLLDNEGLTSALDDDAAKLLLNWGIGRAESIVQGTEGLTDEAAEEAMYAPMRALRRLMKLVNRWLPERGRPDRAGDKAALKKVLDQAALVYGADFIQANSKMQSRFLTQIQSLDVTPTMSALLAFLAQRERQAKKSVGATIASGVQPSIPTETQPHTDSTEAEKEISDIAKTKPSEIAPAVEPPVLEPPVLEPPPRGLFGRLRKTRLDLTNFFFGHF